MVNSPRIYPIGLAVAAMVGAGCREATMPDLQGPTQSDRVSGQAQHSNRIVVCHVDRHGRQTISVFGAHAAAAHLAHGDTPGPCVPQLLSPPDGSVLPQNNATATCTADPPRGSGFTMSFAWAQPRDRRSVIAGYFILAINRGASVPLINAFTADTQFTFVDCNAFAIDPFLSGWEWKVRAMLIDGTLGDYSPVRTWSFEPCKLPDGTPCHT